MKQKYQAQKTFRASPELNYAEQSAFGPGDLWARIRTGNEIAPSHPRRPPVAEKAILEITTHRFALATSVEQFLVTSYANVYFLPSITMIKR